MTKINTNREVHNACKLTEPAAELQRLRTFNTLLLDTLRALYDAHERGRKPGDHVTHTVLMKRVKKVIA